MCQLKVIRKTTNGILLYCLNSNTFQLSYKNILLSLNKQELTEFTKYIDNINCMYWEEEYKNSIYTKKIPLPSTQHNLMMLFTPSEIEELKSVLGISNSFLLPIEAIDYKFVLN